MPAIPTLICGGNYISNVTYVWVCFRHIADTQRVALLPMLLLQVCIWAPLKRSHTSHPALDCFPLFNLAQVKRRGRSKIKFGKKKIHWDKVADPIVSTCHLIYTHAHAHTCLRLPVVNPSSLLQQSALWSTVRGLHSQSGNKSVSFCSCFSLFLLFSSFIVYSFTGGVNW